MARKKLNKKVAIVGGLIFALMMLAGIVAFLYLSQDAEKLVKDGDVALLQKDYKKAASCYGKAVSSAKTDVQKVEIYFKIADLNIEINEWNSVRAYWDRIVKIDPKNVKARFGLLQYLYIMADSGANLMGTKGARQIWQNIASQASEFIEVVEPALLTENISQWDYFQESKGKADSLKLGPYLYLLKGGATFELAKMGATAEKEKMLEEAISDLEKVRELAPENIDAFLYLSEAFTDKSKNLANKGENNEAEQAKQQAEEILRSAIEIAGEDDVRAQITLLKMKLTLAQVGSYQKQREMVEALEPEYSALIEKFPTNAVAYAETALYYHRLGIKNLDKAIEYIDKASKLDSQNVSHAITAADFHYRKFAFYRQLNEVDKTVEIANDALTLLGAYDKPGPYRLKNRMNRISLNMILARCYFDQLLIPQQMTEPKKKELFTKAEDIVYQIEQLMGSSQDPIVVKWQGMLEMAKGNKHEAIKKLYSTYQQYQTSGQLDGNLSYFLSKLFKNDVEIGAFLGFLATTINSGYGEIRPEVHLDYAEAIMELKGLSSAVMNIDRYEELSGPDTRSRSLRIKTLIAKGNFEEAEQIIKNHFSPQEANTLQLRLELQEGKIKRLLRLSERREAEKDSKVVFEKFLRTLEEQEKVKDENLNLPQLNEIVKGYVDLIQKLLQTDPNSVKYEQIRFACNTCIRTGQIKEGIDLVDKVLEHFQNDVTALFYKEMFSEQGTEKIDDTPEKRNKLQEKVYLSISDPFQRSVKLGVFYKTNNQPEQAVEQLNFLLNTCQDINDFARMNEEKKQLFLLGLGHLFEASLALEKFQIPENIVEIAHRYNLDQCQGKLYAANLAVAKKEYTNALALLEECLKERPVFSVGFILRSKVNSLLGNEHSAIEDAQVAVSLNPINGEIAKTLASLLYKRNRGLGDNITSDQIIETRTAFDRAVALNPSDVDLLRYYADFISEDEPERALAIMQSLFKARSDINNAIFLGRLATKIAISETKEDKKQALFAMAESALNKAQQMEPNNQSMLESYSNLYQAMGRGDEAIKLVESSGDKELLWKQYFQKGNYAEAKKVLEDLHQTETNDVDVLRGLLSVAVETGNIDDVNKYSEEVISTDESVENYLMQIQSFLQVGLAKEAKYKLQSLKEREIKDNRVILLEAWLLMQEGRLKRALELTNEYLQTDQDNSTAWRLRGQINLMLGNYEQTISDFRNSISGKPDPTTRIALAKAYFLAGREEYAITELKNVIDNALAPVEGGLLLERIYRQLNRREDLKRYYQELIQRYPNNLIWYQHAGEFLLSIEDYAKAEQIYAISWQKTDNRDPVSLSGYLQALIGSEKFDKVLEEGAKYVNTPFAPIAFTKMAEAKLKIGDKDGAIQYFQKAIEKAGTNEQSALIILKRMYLLLGADEVKSYCEKLIKENPDSLVANFTMYQLMKIKEDYNKAIDYVNNCMKIVESSGKDPTEYIMQRIEILESAYNKTSDKNYIHEAIKDCESLLSKMPNNLAVSNNLAYLLAQSEERIPEALEYARNACEERPNKAEFLDTYSYVLYEAQKYTEAAEYARAALQQYELRKITPPSTIYDLLGKICEKLGETKEALAAYKQALESGDNILGNEAKERIKSSIEMLSSKIQD